MEQVPKKIKLEIEDMSTYINTITASTTGTSSTSYTTGTTTTTIPTYTTYDSTPLYTLMTGNIDEYKQALEKADRHMDRLEEDIQFLNDKREAQEAIIANLLARLEEAESKIVDLTDLLDTTKSYAEWVENRLAQVEKRND